MSQLPYSVSFEDIAFASAGDDLLVFTAAAAVPVTLHRIELSWEGTSQEVCKLSLLRRSGAGTGGTGITPRALNSRNTVAAAATVTRSVAAANVGAAGSVLWTYQQNLVVPVDELFGLDALKIVIPGGTFLALNLVSAPGSSRKASLTVFFSE
jgi:hypothetical protein